jgi:hypothetical protein
VPGAGDVAHASAQVRAIVRAQPVERGADARLKRRVQVRRDQFGLPSEQPICRAVGFEQPHKKQIGLPAMEDVQVEVEDVLSAIEFRLGQKREPFVIARGPHDEIDFLARAVDKPDGTPIKRCHVPAGLDVAMSQVVQNLRVEDRV